MESERTDAQLFQTFTLNFLRLDSTITRYETLQEALHSTTLAQALEDTFGAGQAVGTRILYRGRVLPNATLLSEIEEFAQGRREATVHAVTLVQDDPDPVDDEEAPSNDDRRLQAAAADILVAQDTNQSHMGNNVDMFLGFLFGLALGIWSFVFLFVTRRPSQKLKAGLYLGFMVGFIHSMNEAMSNRQQTSAASAKAQSANLQKAREEQAYWQAKKDELENGDLDDDPDLATESRIIEQKLAESRQKVSSQERRVKTTTAVAEIVKPRPTQEVIDRLSEYMVKKQVLLDKLNHD